MVKFRQIISKEMGEGQMKIAYLGIDLLKPVLDALLEEGCRVLKLFTCPVDNVTEFNTAVLRTAQARGIPHTLERITPVDLAELAAQGCELLVCAGYYYRAPITDAFPMVNFHPTPLPAGRGSWPMPRLILDGAEWGGVTAHKMAAEFDTGEILLRERFPLDRREDHQTYMEKVYERVPGMVRELVNHLPQVLAYAQPQGAGEYWAVPAEADWTVTPDMEAARADLILRAFYGYECVYRDGERKTELVGGRVIYGSSGGRAFPVKGGYVAADRIRELT